MQSFDLTQGDSYTIGVRFDNRYTITDLQELKVYCFGLSFTPIVTSDPRVYRIEIESDTTFNTKEIVITLTNNDSIAAGDMVTITLDRDVTVGSNASGDCFVYVVSFEDAS